MEADGFGQPIPAQRARPMPRRDVPHTPRCSGFTLVEILVVVVVLGVLAAVVAANYGGSISESQKAALMAQLRTIDTTLGRHPPGSAIDPSWFRGGAFPTHPQNSAGEPAFEVVATAGLLHPANKVLTQGVGGAYWYNTAEAVVRARVADQGSSAATLALYNEINVSSEASLGNYAGGGGGS